MKLEEYHASRFPIEFKKKIAVVSCGSIAGRKEGEGPISSYIDEVTDDPLLGEASFEKAESPLCKKAPGTALDKAGINDRAIDILLAGELMNQCTAAGYGLEDLDIP